MTINFGSSSCLLRSPTPRTYALACKKKERTNLARHIPAIPQTHTPHAAPLLRHCVPLPPPVVAHLHRRSAPPPPTAACEATFLTFLEIFGGGFRILESPGGFQTCAPISSTINPQPSTNLPPTPRRVVEAPTSLRRRRHGRGATGQLCSSTVPSRPRPQVHPKPR